MTDIKMAAEQKYDALIALLRGMGKVYVAYSGGVDSAFLLRAAREALGENVTAVTASSAMFPAREMAEAREYCGENGIRHIVVEHREMEIPGFPENPPDKCYICKRDLFGRLKEMAENDGAVVVEGSNADDIGDYRPGMRAVAELGIRSPLLETGFSKEEIREMSRRLGLKTWDKPSFACLSSRIPYGERITPKKLAMIEEAEQFLMDEGFRQFRVRMHGNTARIELLEDEIPRLMEGDLRTRTAAKMRDIGFDHASCDLTGYRRGSMNEVLDK